MPAAHSEDGRILYPWVMKDVEKLWNTHFSYPFTWRVFTLGKSGSSKKASYRLSIILRKNASWLGCSGQTDIDEIYEQFRIYLLGASAYLQKHGVQETSEALDRPLEITMTFWRFLEPSLKHLHEMTHLSIGNEPGKALQADLDRRQEKARILKEFSVDLKDFAKRAAYFSGSEKDSNQRLEQALVLARQAMDRAIEDLQWMES